MVKCTVKTSTTCVVKVVAFKARFCCVLRVWMVFLCGNGNVKLVDIDSCSGVQADVSFCPCCCPWRMLSRRQRWRTTTCFLLTMVVWTLFGWDVRSFTCEGHSDRAPYEKGNAYILYTLSVHLQWMRYCAYSMCIWSAQLHLMSHWLIISF